MIEASHVPAIAVEFGGVSDLIAIQSDVDGLREQLAVASSQMALERTLAKAILRARSIAVMGSPALQQVFDADPDAMPSATMPESPSDTSLDIALSAAFLTRVSSPALPDGFAKTMARDLRMATHTDAGKDAAVAMEVGQALSGLKADQGLAIADAMLAAPATPATDSTTLRIERYRLQLALNGTVPHFATPDQAQSAAQVEIEGADWRVRSEAAIKTFELITGDSATWNTFLQNIAYNGKTELITMVNQLQPAMLALCERLVKGQPLSAEALDLTAIDDILGHIWSAIGNQKDDKFPYKPPYQHWLAVLLPALKMLDPGQKPGEEYAIFQPPIHIKRPPEILAKERDTVSNLGGLALKGLLFRP